MSRPITLVVNPTSGQGASARRERDVVAALRAAGFAPDVVRTASIEEVGAAVRTAADPVAVLGGDGTVAEALNAALVAGRLVAPLPGGRGNDLCRALGIDPDPVRAALDLARATERRIDAGLAGGRAFANVLSIGYDATVSDLARVSRVPGTLSYVWAGLRALAAQRLTSLTIDVDGIVTHHEAWFCSVSSSGWFGGGKHVAPTSRLDDGVLEVVVAEGMSRLRLVPVLLGLFTGGHVRRRGVSVRSGRVVRIDGAGPVWADGEYVGELPLVVEVRPGALRVLCRGC